MSTEKLSELSKPVAYKFDHGVMGPGDFKYGTPQMHSAAKDENASPLYSQEYVSALLAELEAKDKRIAELDRSETQLIEERDVAHDAIDAMYEAATGERPEWSNWFGFADAIEEVAQVRAELEAIRSIAEKLVRCKGRYHSEQNYRALAALFGVTTPDLPPVDGDDV